MAINVITNSYGNGFTCLFKNGVITIDNNPGGYIISTGCGAGKTESIKKLISQKKDLGIVYCVDTINEVDKMYNFLIDNSILAESEILRLHGDKSAETELKTYLNNPDAIMTKKVVLLTHVRFWTDLIDHFLIFKPKTAVTNFDGDFKKLMQRDDLRKYIIFDETPMFHKAFIEISKSVLGCLSKKNRGKWKCKDQAEIKEAYMKFIENTPSAFSNTKHKLGRIKRDVALACIPKFWDEWFGSNKSNMELSFYPTDLCQTGMQTHVLIYEGAGDLLLRGTKTYKLLTIKNKYNSIVNFTNSKITMQARRGSFDKSLFDKMLYDIENILKKRAGKKTLIVSWKNIGRSRGEENKTGKSEWCDLIDSHLMAKGFKNGIDYSITYFGGSDTKSTNKYRDYTAMILLGDWNTPKTFASSVRKAFGANTTIEEYRLWYYVQLLCRIGIRNLSGGTFEIYYTDDYKPVFIDKLSLYLNNNTYTPLKTKSSKKGWFDEIAEKSKIKIKQKLEIEKLFIIYTDLKDAVETKKHYTLTISLTDLIKYLPRKEKKRRSYDSLKKSFAKIGITLDIT